MNMQIIIIFSYNCHFSAQPIRFKSAASKKVNIIGFIKLINPNDATDKYSINYNIHPKLPFLDPTYKVVTSCYFN